MTASFIIAVPKGRILRELKPVLQSVGILPEPAFFDEDARQLQFATNLPHLSMVRVRSFDVATFVAFGAAQIGVAGSDVLMEFDYGEIYAPVDLGIGRCRLAVAAPEGTDPLEMQRASHVRIATKYPRVTERYYSARGIQAECIHLNGAVELAPKLGLSTYIVDLVSTGETLRANGLRQMETIAEVSSRLIVHRASFKTRSAEMSGMIAAFRQTAHAS